MLAVVEDRADKIVPPPRPGSRLPPGRLHWTQIPGSAIVVQDKAYAIGQAVEAGRIDAVIFPTWAQLPVINGDRNSQLVADLKPSQNLCYIAYARGIGQHPAGGFDALRQFEPLAVTEEGAYGSDQT